MDDGASYPSISANGQARQHNGNAYNTNTYHGNAFNAQLHNGHNYTNTTATHHGHVFQGPATNYNMSDSPNPFAQALMSQGAPTELHEACKTGDEGLVISCLDKGDNIETKNDMFMTPLQVAVSKNQINVARLLLSRGANVDARYVMWAASQLPVLLAVMNRNEDMVRLLVEHGADIEEYGTKGMTPLLMAADNGSDRIVAFLLSKGANAEARHVHGKHWTPLELALFKRHPKSAMILRQHRASGGTAVQPETGPSAPVVSPEPTRSTQAPVSPPSVISHVSPGPQQSHQYPPPPQQNPQYPTSPQQYQQFSSPPQQYQQFSPPPQQSQHFSQPPQRSQQYPPPQHFQQYQPQPQQNHPPQQYNPAQSYSPSQQHQQYQLPQQYNSQQHQSSPAMSPPSFQSGMPNSAPPPKNDFSRVKPGLTKLWKHAKTFI